MAEDRTVADAIQDPAIIPSDAELTKLGITAQAVQQYPQLKAYHDIQHYAIADACRKALVGNDGTNLQMINVIRENEKLVQSQVVLFLLKNQIKPMASNVFILAPLVEETAKRLGEGNVHAVNRRSKLIDDGVLKPAGDDIVPRAIRAAWVPQ